LVTTTLSLFITVHFKPVSNLCTQALLLCVNWSYWCVCPSPECCSDGNQSPVVKPACVITSQVATR